MREKARTAERKRAMPTTDKMIVNVAPSPSTAHDTVKETKIMTSLKTLLWREVVLHYLRGTN